MPKIDPLFDDRAEDRKRARQFVAGLKNDELRNRIVEVLAKYNVHLTDAPLDALTMAVDRMIENRTRFEEDALQFRWLLKEHGQPSKEISSGLPDVLPRIGEFVIYDGLSWVVDAIIHDRDNNRLEIALKN